jgi:hypothetical protein
MSNERLDKLATYFIHFNVRERYGITFARFIEIVERGKWSDYVGI